MFDKPEWTHKMLIGLNQKVSGQVQGLQRSPAADDAPPAERHDLTRSVIVTERGKPVVPPFGQGSRKTTCRGCGQRRGGASERRSVMERIGVAPSGNITPRRKPADLPRVFRHERTLAN